MKISLAAIVGPTATGKSGVGIEAADILDGEIISVDSMQVYKGLDIGTAKVPEKDRYSCSGKHIPHHLIDIIEPTEDFSVADFQRYAREKIMQIHERNKLPLLVGGTGLYYHATIRGYDFSSEARNDELREVLKSQAQEHGCEYLHKKLYSVDPEAAKKIHPNNRKRIIRALEYYYTTGKRISNAQDNNENVFDAAPIGLYLEREKLYEYINERVEKMFERGLVEEVRLLLEKGCSSSDNAMQGLGYRQVIKYLNGEYDLETCKDVLKKDTRRFAKRQLTWFRRDNDIIWYNVLHYKNRRELAEAAAWDIRQRLQMLKI